MSRFLICRDGREYSYGQLLSAVNAGDGYFPVMRTGDLFAWYVNLIRALSHNRPVTLIDADVSAGEIPGLAAGEINSETPCGDARLQSVAEMIGRVAQSSSRVTFFTSGTTGQPKRVAHQVEALTRLVRRGARHEGDIWGLAYNPSHMAGIQVFFQAFLNGNPIVDLFGASRREVYRLVRELEVSHISATPTFYRLLLPCETALPAVRRVTFGGERSGASLYASLERLFPNARFNNIYASTEAGSLLVASGEGFRIPHGMEGLVKVSPSGELMVHASLIGETEGLESIDGYYLTGDLVEAVGGDTGLFRFAGRRGAMINTGGYKVNPEEVEDALLGIDGVSQAVVYGRHNSVTGNLLCADVVMCDGAAFDEARLREWLRRGLQDYKIPRRIRRVESMEMTRTGKMKRR